MRLIDDFGPSRLPTTNFGAGEIPFQRWFHFKEAYSPSLVISLLTELNVTKGNILDPFGGSGTTSLVGSIIGLNAYTIEVNPFLADIIKAKTARYKLHDLMSDQLQVLQKANRLKPNLIRDFSYLPETFIQGRKKERWLFNTDVAERLSQLFHSLHLSEINEENRRLLRILLGGCLISSSNVYINGKGRRYRRNWENLDTSAQTLDELYTNKISAALSDISKYSTTTKKGTVKVIHGDSRTELRKIDQEFEFVMFSPPYPNSFDYTDVYNVELWMLKYLSSAEQNKLLRKKTLRSHVQVRHDLKFEKMDSSSLNKCYKKLCKVRTELWDKNIPEMVYAYFNDLAEIFLSSHRTLVKNGYLAAVVGDSQYLGIQVPVAQILTELAPSWGFKVISSKPSRSMRTSPQQGGMQQLAESLILLRRR